MRKKAFFRNLPTIASLGILGTYIAFAVITFTLYGFSRVLGITLAVSLAADCPRPCMGLSVSVLTSAKKRVLMDVVRSGSLLLSRYLHAVCLGQRQQTAFPQNRHMLQDCLALGAIFAMTDSVAVLQVLEQDRAPLLFNLVFGEGVINDATTVALLRTVQV